MYETSMKPLEIKKLKRTFLDYRVQNVPKISSKTSVLWLVQNSQALRRKENKVEFLEGQFRNEKLSFVHKKETEYSFEL